MSKAKRGKQMWVPPVVIDELEDIRREDDLCGGTYWRPIAFTELVRYARVGRETKRLMKLDFTKSIPQMNVEDYPLRQKKVWKKVKRKKW